MNYFSHRLNIEIFGSLLSNAVFRRDCWYITDLMNRAVDGQLALDDKCIRSLEKFKKETMERMTRHASSHQFSLFIGRILIFFFLFFNTGEWRKG